MIFFTEPEVFKITNLEPNYGPESGGIFLKQILKQIFSKISIATKHTKKSKGANIL